MADDAVTTTVLAATCPVLLAPAMNTRMWRNPATVENLAALRARGCHVVGPGAGELADGDVGEGRLAEPEEIAVAASRLLGNRDLVGRRVLVTAGPTREPIDPVRFISNPSSGKMGYAIARVAASRGADVTLVSGPTQLPDPAGVKVVRVETAEQMARAVELEHGAMDLFVGAAAVSDYRPATPSPQKIKKSPGDETLVLARTPDILAGLGARFAGRRDAPVLVGFAAETDEVIARAREKLKGKRCDLVVANKVGGPGAGFGGDTNRVALVSAAELAEIEGTKEKVAEAILDWILPVLEGRRPRPRSRVERYAASLAMEAGRTSFPWIALRNASRVSPAISCASRARMILRAVFCFSALRRSVASRRFRAPVASARAGSLRSPSASTPSTERTASSRVSFTRSGSSTRFRSPASARREKRPSRPRRAVARSERKSCFETPKGSTDERESTRSR
jgi:phosphopantothenoylcysteine decarboxylase/phosphopantothenate--cysteine ligase